MPFIWAALMPHPPVLVAEVGKGREREAGPSLEGAKRLCARLAEVNAQNPPEALFILSPHAPSAPDALFINKAENPHGSLARFGAPAAEVTLQSSPELLEEISEALRKGGLPFAQGLMPDITQDHGTIVPLRFIAQSFPGGKLPPVILAGPSGLSPDQALTLGDILHKLSGKRRWALLASGDLSHRLKANGPYGFNAAGPIFDAAVVAALKAGDPAPLLDLPKNTAAGAGECGLRPVLCLLRLAQRPLEIFSYEGPFGVGYCHALWINEGLTPALDQKSAPATNRKKSKAPAASVGHPYPRLARMVISSLLYGRDTPKAEEIRALSPDQDIWSEHKGCFVSIKTKAGALRGCIGTFLPVQNGLGKEISANAVSASTRDPRFPPMRAEELENVRISVDVLETPEILREGMDLDPKLYGVIVSKNGRRGLLLPDLEGVDTVEKQLSIAAQKGGISDLRGAQIQRFTVQRYFEDKDGTEE